jgi:hypothetical protein
MGGKAAVLLLREKTTDEHGNLREMVIWRVRRTRQRPDGVRYRLALILAGEQEPAILYDNHHPKGHHRHIRGTEEPYPFVDVGQLIADFRAEVTRMIGAEK